MAARQEDRKQVVMAVRYYVIICPRDRAFAVAWGESPAAALMGARQQRADAELIGPPHRWKWAAKLAVWVLRNDSDYFVRVFRERFIWTYHWSNQGRTLEAKLHRVKS